MRLEFLAEGQRVGGMMFGRPEARLLNDDCDHILELTRMYFEPFYQGEKSRALSMARKFIRTWFPQVRILLSYADPEQGHDGTIYVADGWGRFGRTNINHSGWRSRAGRTDACGHSKIRFLRTP